MRALLLVVLFLAAALAARSNCNRVAFRIDDIQDWWLTNAQKAVMDVFRTKKYPLTAGIIANSFNTGDATMVNYLKAGLQDSSWRLEIANHGYNHEDFSTFSLEDQKELFRDSVSQTVDALSPYISTITTFMPPFNAFNSDTIKALKATGFNLMSSDISFYDSRPYPGTDPSLKEFPVGSATTDLSDSYKISAEESFAMIQDQMGEAGFSAVMMHFVEFTDNGDVDPDAIQDLKKLIQLCLDAGYVLSTLKELGQYCYGSSPTPAPPTPTPSPTPTPTPTPPSAPATTKKPTPATSTTGKATSTTGGRTTSTTTGTAHTTPPPSGSTGGSSTCTLGDQRCVGTSQYQTCSWVSRTETGWAAPQNCASGLRCTPVQGGIWCVR